MWVAFCIFITITTISYTLYFHWGSSQYLAEYYAPESELLRQKHKAFRPLLAEFIKEEFRLSARLEENPKDIEAQYRLYDLLAIKALQGGDQKLAAQYWNEAAKIAPEELKKEYEAKVLKFTGGKEK